MSESFEEVMKYAYTFMLDYDIPTIERLKDAHDRELEQAKKAEYARGYEDGRRSMDAEHRAVALRLQQLPLDEDSHGNLNQIARALYHSDFGWTQGACRGLRDELIRLLGGVHDEPVPMGGDCCASDADCVRGNGERGRLTEYDVLGNERHKVICELRKLDFEHIEQYGWMMWHALNKALGIETYDSDGSEAEPYILIRDRLIHLLGGDEPTESFGSYLSRKSVDAMSRRAESDEGGDGVSMSASSVSITDELREWNRTTPYLGKGGFELHEIAGHIDSEFARLLKQKDDAWQATCEHVSDECDAECQMYRDMLNDAAREFRDLVAEHECCREERDELQAKLDAVREALDGR